MTGSTPATSGSWAGERTWSFTAATIGLLDRAEERLRDLESIWSRFLPESDITRANRAAGTPVRVHPDTIAVVCRALDGWRQTGGRFDVTVLPALVTNGYTHSAVSAAPAPAVPGERIGLSAWIGVDVQSSTITVPATSAIDLGGIGKGYAADLVADELFVGGATGAMVNIGGDIAIRGVPSDGADWLVGIEDPTAVPSHVALAADGVGGHRHLGHDDPTVDGARGPARRDAPPPHRPGDLAVGRHGDVDRHRARRRLRDGRGVRHVGDAARPGRRGARCWTASASPASSSDPTARCTGPVGSERSMREQPDDQRDDVGSTSIDNPPEHDSLRRPRAGAARHRRSP